MNYLLPAKDITLNAIDSIGDTALHRAIRIGEQVETVQLLIAKGIDFNRKNNDGMTPLHLAISEGLSDIAVLLIKKSAHIAPGLLHLAISKRLTEVATLLIQKDIEVNRANSYGKVPLHLAIENGLTDIVALLITKGADIDYGNPLYLAISEGQTEIATLLIEKGANIHQSNPNYTVLRLAARKGNLKIVKLLAKKGVDLNQKDERGCTALHEVVAAQAFKVARVLLACGAEINQPDIEGNTTLYYAVRAASLKRVGFSLQWGANLHHENHEGRKPLEEALTQTPPSQKIVLMLLLAKGNILKADILLNRFPKIQALLSNLSFDLKERALGLPMIKAMQVLPFEFHIRQFELRQRLLAYLTRGDRDIHLLCTIIALQHHSPAYQKNSNSPRYAYSPWFVILNDFRQFKQYAKLKIHRLNWYDYDARITSCLPLDLLQLAEVTKQLRKKIILKDAFSKKENFEVFFQAMLKLPFELRKAIAEKSLSESVIAKYRTEISSSHAKDTLTFFEKYKGDMEAFHEGCFEITKAESELALASNTG